ncbi:MAG: hypothetical protein ACI814_005035, partial [Mariniblastus sp.]
RNAMKSRIVLDRGPQIPAGDWLRELNRIPIHHAPR